VARIAGINIPTNKRVEIALRYIHGIGPAKAKSICEAVSIAPERRVQDLTDQEILQIRENIDGNHQVEGDLRRENNQNIKRLMDMGNYRGLRHRRGLITRWQKNQAAFAAPIGRISPPESRM